MVFFCPPSSDDMHCRLQYNLDILCLFVQRPKKCKIVDKKYMITTEKLLLI